MASKPIRVILCSYPSIFSDVVLKALLKTQEIDVVGIIYSSRVFSEHENFLQTSWRMLAQSGLHYSLMQFMQTDVYCLFKKLRHPCIKAPFPILSTKNINQKQGLDFLAHLKPDVILLANFNQKVSSKVIASAKLQCINLHPSLLPDYKGVDPVFAALNANEKKLGVTVHQVDEAFDTGDILRQQSLNVEKKKSAFYHQFQLFKIGAKLATEIILQSLPLIEKCPQLNTGRYDSWATVAQVKAFRKQGMQLINGRDYYHACKNAFKKT